MQSGSESWDEWLLRQEGTPTLRSLVGVKVRQGHGKQSQFFLWAGGGELCLVDTQAHKHIWLVHVHLTVNEQMTRGDPGRIPYWKCLLRGRFPPPWETWNQVWWGEWWRYSRRVYGGSTLGCRLHLELTECEKASDSHTPALAFPANWLSRYFPDYKGLSHPLMKGFEICSETRRLEGKGIFLPYALQTLEIHCAVIQIVNSLRIWTDICLIYIIVWL